MKRLIALILAVVMLFALAACGKSERSAADTKVSNKISEGKAIPDDATLKVTIASHASWPYNEDWAVWKYIKEGVGGNITVTAIPSSDFATKFSVMMVDKKSLPDLIGFQGKASNFNDLCEQGAFLAFEDYKEYLPDYEAFWKSVPEEDQWMRETRRQADGKIYYSPIYGMERSTNVRAWLYRKDIFDKHGLKTPTTMEELYQVAKQLKKLYPKSYPLCMRSGLGNLSVIGSSWKPGFCYSEYYDFENKKWSYGATEETLLEMIKYFKRMVAEELVPKDFLTINTATWEELVSTDRGFIMPEYQVRIDHFGTIAKGIDPNTKFLLTAMVPPHADNGVGVPMLNKYNNDPTGYAAVNTGFKGAMVNSMRYINWMYSDEGAEAVSWGREGETYKVVDGKREFIVDESKGESAQKNYGFKTIGSYIRIDPTCIDASISKEQAETTDFVLEYTYPDLNPTMWLSLSSEDQELVSQYKTQIDTVVQENIQKFILGQRPLSDWDKFQAELAKLPIKELLKIYEDAYNKVGGLK